ncbi:MAG: VRR-NUC protein [Caudoviricetes sp.]|nr:MAG: VRR-NUC protein [Caudoviricetes sp.]
MKRKIESALQGECYVWFSNTYCLKHHKPRLVWFLVPNEIASVVGSVLKSMGVSNSIITKAVSMIVDGMKRVGFLGGVSDNIILADGGRTFLVEFKLEGNNQQPNQVDFQQRAESLGHTYVVIKSLTQFKEFCAINFMKPYKHTNEE